MRTYSTQLETGLVRRLGRVYWRIYQGKERFKNLFNSTRHSAQQQPSSLLTGAINYLILLHFIMTRLLGQSLRYHHLVQLLPTTTQNQSHKANTRSNIDQYLLLKIYTKRVLRLKKITFDYLTFLNFNRFVIKRCIR